jgi:membrane-associated phospholipid phosphatase
MPRLTIAASVAFLGLAALVQAGTTASLDHWALHHLQPLINTDWTYATDPADPLLTTALFAAGCLLLRRRGRSAEAAAWLVALGAGFTVEIAGKEFTGQLDYTEHERVFDLFTLPRSFPSGHSLRAVLLAGLTTALWPRLRGWAIPWAITTATITELCGMHVPTDVLGGLLAGLALASWASPHQPTNRAPIPAPPHPKAPPPAQPRPADSTAERSTPTPGGRRAHTPAA